MRNHQWFLQMLIMWFLEEINPNIIYQEMYFYKNNHFWKFLSLVGSLLLSISGINITISDIVYKLSFYISLMIGELSNKIHTF